MNITVIGCGRWGSLITWYLDRTGHQVTLYGRPESARMQRFLTDRSNDLLTLPESVALSTDLACVKDAEVIIISIGSQSLRGLMEELRLMVLRDKTFVLCMKGLEIGTGERLSQVAREYLEPLRQEGRDVLILGCTHYPLLTDIIREIMGPEVSLVNAGAESVHTLHDALARRQLLAPEGTGQALLCTSDRPEGFGQMARRFLQEEPTAPVRLVDIERY